MLHRVPRHHTTERNDSVRTISTTMAWEEERPYALAYEQGARITCLRARSDIVSCVSPSSYNTTHHWQGCVHPSPLDHARALANHSYASRSILALLLSGTRF